MCLRRALGLLLCQIQLHISFHLFVILISSCQLLHWDWVAGGGEAPVQAAGGHGVSPRVPDM